MYNRIFGAIVNSKIKLLSRAALQARARTRLVVFWTEWEHLDQNTGADKPPTAEGEGQLSSGELDEEEDDDDEPEETLKDRGATSCSSSRRSDKSSRSRHAPHPHHHHQQQPLQPPPQQQQHHHQQQFSDDETDEELTSSAELSSSSDVGRSSGRRRHFVPSAPPPRPAHATRATATEGLCSLLNSQKHFKTKFNGVTKSIYYVEKLYYFSQDHLLM